MWFSISALAVAILLQATVTTAQSDAPSVDSFLRRTNARATLVGDYVYFDGGEVAQRGFMRPGRPSNGMNSTLSIDVSRSWSAEDVRINLVSKPETVPSMVKQGLFRPPSSDSFYIWGGMTAYFQPVPQARLWQFTTDGSGGGSWGTETPSNPETFLSLDRSESGAFVSTSDAGFWIGGSSTQRTSPNAAGDLSGVTSFNFTTGEWARDSEDAPFSSDGTLYGGSATWVPTFGPNGLVMVLGGMTRRPDAEAAGYIDFGTVHFFDPVTRGWYLQKTTGEGPNDRFDHCAVGVESSVNRTFEMQVTTHSSHPPTHFAFSSYYSKFSTLTEVLCRSSFVFGGRNNDLREVYDDVYILSLPGFFWRKATYTPRSPRVEHACVVVGNRQMLSIGGINAALGNPDFWEDGDPFPQGLGVFDLTEMEWSTTFDADAEAYKSPATVRSWYDEGELEKVEWSSRNVSALFSSRQETEEQPTSRPQDNETRPTTPSANRDGESDDSPATMTVIAGAVTGAVVGIAAIGFGIWFFLRRRRRQALSATTGEVVEPLEAPYKTGTVSYTVTPVVAPSELDNRFQRKAELPVSGERMELQGSTSWPVPELDGTSHRGRM